jgi:hypothetical protein
VIGLKYYRRGGDGAHLAGAGLRDCWLARAGGKRAGAGETEQASNRFQISA